MKVPFQGGCACGRIRYEVTAAPLMMGICHCRECQRSGGTASAPYLMVPAAAVRLTGAPASREYRADGGGWVRHFFCRDCGSPLYGTNERMPEGMAFRAGSLDDPSGFAPQFHLFTASAQPWALRPADLPSFPGMPPALGAQEGARR